MCLVRRMRRSAASHQTPDHAWCSELCYPESRTAVSEKKQIPLSRTTKVHALTQHASRSPNKRISNYFLPSLAFPAAAGPFGSISPDSLVRDPQQQELSERWLLSAGLALSHPGIDELCNLCHPRLPHSPTLMALAYGSTRRGEIFRACHSESSMIWARSKDKHARAP